MTIKEEVPIAPGEARDALGRLAEYEGAIDYDVDIVGARIKELEQNLAKVSAENAALRNVPVLDVTFENIGGEAFTSLYMIAYDHADTFRSHHAHDCKSRPMESETCTCTHRAYNAALRRCHG